VDQGLNISNTHTHTHTTRELAHDAIVLGIVTAQGDAEQF